MSETDKMLDRAEGLATRLAVMKRHIETLRQQLAEAQRQDVDAMRADRERLLAFVGKVRGARDCYEWPQSWHRIEAALAELDAQRAPVAETAGAHAPAMAQQSEEIAYLRARLDEERSVIASLRQQLESALALLTDQRLNAEEQDREIERLRKFADGVRTQVTRYTMSWASWNEIKSALAELDAKPAPVAETAEGGT